MERDSTFLCTWLTWAPSRQDPLTWRRVCVSEWVSDSCKRRAGEWWKGLIMETLIRLRAFLTCMTAPSWPSLHFHLGHPWLLIISTHDCRLIIPVFLLTGGLWTSEASFAWVSQLYLEAQTWVNREDSEEFSQIWRLNTNERINIFVSPDPG